MVGELSIGAARPNTMQKLAARIFNCNNTNISVDNSVFAWFYINIYPEGLLRDLLLNKHSQTILAGQPSRFTFETRSRFCSPPTALSALFFPPFVEPILAVVLLVAGR